MKSLFRIVDGTLVPDEDRAKAWLRRQKTEFVLVEHQGNVVNPNQHRLWWKLVNTAFYTLPEGAQSTYGDLHTFADAIKCELGHCTIKERKGGYTMKMPKSLALGNLEPEFFTDFFQRTEKLLAATLGVTIDDMNISTEERMMGGI